MTTTWVIGMNVPAAFGHVLKLVWVFVPTRALGVRQCSDYFSTFHKFAHVQFFSNGEK